MCGIAGQINFDGEPVSPEILKRMTDAISHRGPDGEGFAGLTEPGAEMSTWQHGETEPAALRLALGHRRLAIVDLSEAGKQPMSSPAGNCWIVFNGE